MKNSPGKDKRLSHQILLGWSWELSKQTHVRKTAISYIFVKCLKYVEKEIWLLFTINIFYDLFMWHHSQSIIIIEIQIFEF